MRAAAIDSTTSGLLNFQAQLSSRIDAVHLTTTTPVLVSVGTFRDAVASFSKPPASIA
jgi:hypothetical protein